MRTYRRTKNVLEVYEPEAEGWYTFATLHEPSGERDADELLAFLAQPEGAREAALVEAVTWSLDNHKLPPYIRRHLQDALADTSPAAAALLAQGGRMEAARVAVRAMDMRYGSLNAQLKADALAALASPTQGEKE